MRLPTVRRPQRRLQRRPQRRPRPGRPSARAVAAACALAAAVVHLLAVLLLDRWPPDLLGVPALFETVPAVLAVVAALVVVTRGDRRPLALACFWAWGAVAFTLPAYALGLAFVPTAVLLSLPFRSPSQ